MNLIDVTVTEARALTGLVKTFVLRPVAGGVLPGFSAGAHVRVMVPGKSAGNCYSLISLSTDPEATRAPESYRIAVRLEDPGRGGSRFMHEEVREGTRLRITPPRNDFPLDLGAERPLLLAGGIGITPIMSMAAALAGAGRPFELHYAGRGRGQLAFVDELAALCGDALHLHYDDEPGSALDLKGLVAGLEPGRPIYVCGPRGMIDATVALAAARGLGVRFELFVDGAAQTGDRAFTVEIFSTGRTVEVPADKTILEALEAAGESPLFDCRRGECGVCRVQVIKGEVEHRDSCLTEDERDVGDCMQICVSRAKGDRLVIDF